jgi:hypothetical protein
MSAIEDEVPHGSVVVAMLWMALVALLLFWLPFFGPLIAGFVGGGMAGTVGRAILAALLPSLLFGAVLLVFGTLLTGIPVIGFAAGLGGLVLALSCSGGLLLGAILGALL